MVVKPQFREKQRILRDWTAHIVRHCRIKRLGPYVPIWGEISSPNGAHILQTDLRGTPSTDADA